MRVKAKEIMSSPVATTSINTPVRDAARLMLEKKIGCLLVTGGEGRFLPVKELGILTERDLLKVLALNLPSDRTSAGHIMSSPIRTCDVDADLSEISSLMHKHDIRRLPVVDGETVVGMVTSTDVAEEIRYLSAKRLSGKKHHHRKD